MKKSGGGRLKCAVYESTLSTADAVPLPRWGRRRGGGSAAKKKANPASLRSAAPSKGRGSRGYSLLPMEGGRIAHSPYRHPERSRGIFLAQRLASTCPFTETTHGDCVFAFPKHISLISLQGRFLGFARNDDTSGTQFHILASPFPSESVEPDRILSQT